MRAKYPLFRKKDAAACYCRGATCCKALQPLPDRRWLRRWPHLPITVYAKELDVRKTTSFKSGGQFQPSGIYEEYEGDEQRNVLADYIRRSRDRINEIGDLRRWNHYGIALRRNYTLDHA